MIRDISRFGPPEARSAPFLRSPMGQTRANNAIVRLGPNGDVAVFCSQGAGTVHFKFDVIGYLQ
jgi:hypothetical protein